MIRIPPESYIGVHTNPYGSNVVVGKYTSIANGLRVICASHPSVIYNTVSNYPFYERHKLDYPKCQTGGKIIIGNDVWIGENACIVGEVNIGDGAIIGAFSVVAKDVPPYSIVAGSPIRILRYRFNQEQINKLLKMKWWDFPKKKLFKAVPDMRDIDKFLDKYE